MPRGECKAMPPGDTVLGGYDAIVVPVVCSLLDLLYLRRAEAVGGYRVGTYACLNGRDYRGGSLWADCGWLRRVEVMAKGLRWRQVKMRRVDAFIPSARGPDNPPVGNFTYPDLIGKTSCEDSRLQSQTKWDRLGPYPKIARPLAVACASPYPARRCYERTGQLRAGVARIGARKENVECKTIDQGIEILHARLKHQPGVGYRTDWFGVFQ